MLDKERIKQEQKLMDEFDALQGALDRSQKECDRYKKKYADASDQIQKAFNEMTNYSKILETLENNVK